jgi:hypothetical protein
MRMDKTSLLLIPALSVAATACVATTQARVGARPGAAHVAPAAADALDPVAESAGDSGPGRAPDEDEHWFTGEDYLVSRKAYEGTPRLFVRQGKMMARPTGATKSEAQFLLTSGKELWTAHYWRTRPGVESDLRVGAVVFCPHSGRMPREKKHARSTWWVVGAITDVSDLYKGMIAVGTRECEVGAVRVAIE